MQQTFAQIPPFTRSYDTEAIVLSSSTSLYYSVDTDNDVIHLGVYINDTTSLSSTTEPVWAGLGIGEQTSGSMVGADMVTIQFPGGSNSSSSSVCELHDRYVPWASYPWIEPPMPFPLLDDCPDSDWVVVSCTHTPIDGSIVFEVRRSLSISPEQEYQDRPILSGPNNILAAHGAGGLSYHGGRNRVSARVTFFDDGNSGVLFDDSVPDDVDGFFDILATGYEIPADVDTTYACTTEQVPIEEGRMIVAVEPLINDDMMERGMVHHFTVYLCEGEEYYNVTKNTVTCGGNDGDDDEDNVFGPLGNNMARCTNFVYGYAKGSGRLVYPDDVGVSVTAKRPYLVMETHFDNAQRLPGIKDSSGVRVYYTDTARKHRAGSILVGDSLVSLYGKQVVHEHHYQFSCPSACTSRLEQPINLFTSFLHMHTTGREIYTNVFRGGELVHRLNSVNFWSDSFQQTRVLQPPVVLTPGDTLQLSCIYDTRKRPNTTFGGGTLNEMCMDFIMYWPLQTDEETGHEFNLCTFFEFGGDINQNGTVCAENGRLTDFFNSPETFPMAPNPELNDTAGAPTLFGQVQNVDTCDAHDSEVEATLEPDNIIDSNDMAPSNIPLVPTTPAPATTSTGNVTPSSSASPSVTAAPVPLVDVDESNNDEAVPTPPTTADDDDDVCFPASATVQLRGGVLKRMDELVVGDDVLVASSSSTDLEQYSTVFMFTHRDHSVVYNNFVTLRTHANHSLTVTAGHYVYVDDGQLVQARHVRVGQRLGKSNDDGMVVVNVKSNVRVRGLFNPQTMHGDVVVNGVVTSTFTQSIEPTTAAALLAPVKAAFVVLGRTLGVTLDLSALFD